MRALHKQWSLVYGTAGGGIALAGVNLEFSLLALLIRYGERPAIIGNEFHFELVIFAVVFGVAGNIAEAVFIAKAACHIGHDSGNLAIESWEPGAAPGHLGKTLELVLGLQVGKAAIVESAYKHLLGDAHTVDRHVGLLQFGDGFVQRQPAESIDP